MLLLVEVIMKFQRYPEDSLVLFVLMLLKAFSNKKNCHLNLLISRLLIMLAILSLEILTSDCYIFKSANVNFMNSFFVFSSISWSAKYFIANCTFSTLNIVFVWLYITSRCIYYTKQKEKIKRTKNK